jgi:hypothetical protein
MITIDQPTRKIPLGRGAQYGHLEADPDRFNAEVHKYVYDYGLRQILNDAMAEKKEDGRVLPDDQIRAKAEKRLAALYEGTIRRRSEGRPTGDPVQAELYRLVWDKIHDTYKRAGFYDKLPKGTKNRLLVVANMRAASRGQSEMDAEGDVIARYLESAPDAAEMRERAKRNVAERAASVDELGV